MRPGALPIAIRSMPLVAAYRPDRLNVWITNPPFVWLPAVPVLAAWSGHLVITLRRLARDEAAARGPRVT